MREALLGVTLRERNNQIDASQGLWIAPGLNSTKLNGDKTYFFPQRNGGVSELQER